jgi:hypothetical protein
VINTEGTLEIGGARKHYRLTKPLPQEGRDDGFARFEGMIEIEGEPAKPYLNVRHNKPGGWSESEIYIDGKKAGSVKRDWLPREFVYEGTFQANGQSHSYKITDWVCRAILNSNAMN